MTTLIEEMIRYGVRPSPTEFRLLAESNLAEYRFGEAMYWVTKMTNAGASDEVKHNISKKMIELAHAAYEERRPVPSLLQEKVQEEGEASERWSSLRYSSGALPDVPLHFKKGFFHRPGTQDYAGFSKGDEMHCAFFA